MQLITIMTHSLDRPEPVSTPSSPFFKPARSNAAPEATTPFFPPVQPKVARQDTDKQDKDADTAAVTTDEKTVRSGTIGGAGNVVQLSADPAKAAGASSGPWEEFAENFNKEFKSVLHAFKQHGEPEVFSKAGEKSGNDVSAARLKDLFSETQRDGLMHFIRTEEIPSRIFNVGEQWNLTAQQRILLSAHILAKGKVQPGNFLQRLHARMCFHWAQLTYHYAGATTQNIEADVMGNFDHAGNLVFGNGVMKQLFKGDRVYSKDLPAEDQEGDMADPDKTKRGGVGPVLKNSDQAETLAKEEPGKESKVFRGRTLPFEQLETLQPGDWLYVYNANASPSGGHSVLFSRWAGGVQNFNGVRYREAVVFAQPSKESGGKEHSLNLGGQAVHEGKLRINPVTLHQQASPNSRPATKVEELLPGKSGSTKINGEMVSNEVILSQKNKDYLKRIAGPGFTIKPVKLMAKMKGENVVHIAKIYSHLDESQIALLKEANDTENMETLIRLTQKLRIFEYNVDRFEKNTKTAYEGTEADPVKGSKAKKGLNEQYAEELGTYNSKKDALDAKIKEIDEFVIPIQEQIDVRKKRIDLLQGSLKLTEAVGALAHWVGGTKESGQERAARYRKIKAVKKEVRGLRKEISVLNTPKKKNLDYKRKKLVEEKAALEKKLTFGLAHPGDIHGMDNSTITGKLERIVKNKDGTIKEITLLYPVDDLKALRDPDLD
jgi:hypothetical protein